MTDRPGRRPVAGSVDRLWPAVERRRARRAWQRASTGHARLLAAGAVAAAFAGGAQLAPSFTDPTGHRLVVAADDLPAGHRVQDGDLAVVDWPGGAGPTGALARPQGRVLAAPVRRGEPFTDVRLVDGDLLRGLPADLRAVPVRLADSPAGLLRAGRHVDVLAKRDDGLAGTATLVVEDALVLVVPTPAEAGPDPLSTAGSGSADAVVVVLAVDGSGARRLAAVAGATLTVALRP